MNRKQLINMIIKIINRPCSACNLVKLKRCGLDTSQYGCAEAQVDILMEVLLPTLGECWKLKETPNMNNHDRAVYNFAIDDIIKAIQKVTFKPEVPRD